MNAELWQKYVEARQARLTAQRAHNEAWSLESSTKHELAMAESALARATRELLDAPDEWREPLKLVVGGVVTLSDGVTVVT